MYNDVKNSLIIFKFGEDGKTINTKNPQISLLFTDMLKNNYDSISNTILFEYMDICPYNNILLNKDNIINLIETRMDTLSISEKIDDLVRIVESICSILVNNNIKCEIKIGGCYYNPFDVIYNNEINNKIKNYIEQVFYRSIRREAELVSIYERKTLQENLINNYIINLEENYTRNYLNYKLKVYNK